MAYKTCENCGCRIFEYGCVNCNEDDYITMQGEYDTPKSKSRIELEKAQASVATDDDSSTKADNQIKQNPFGG